MSKIKSDSNPWQRLMRAARDVLTGADVEVAYGLETEGGALSMRRARSKPPASSADELELLAHAEQVASDDLAELKALETIARQRVGQAHAAHQAVMAERWRAKEAAETAPRKTHTVTLHVDPSSYVPAEAQRAALEAYASTAGLAIVESAPDALLAFGREAVPAELAQGYHVFSLGDLGAPRPGEAHLPDSRLHRPSLRAERLRLEARERQARREAAEREARERQEAQGREAHEDWTRERNRAKAAAKADAALSSGRRL